MSDEHLIGTAGNDFLDGADGNDWLEGLGGHDILIGGEGDDLLEGGAGFDQLDGGPGADTYVFRRGDEQDYVLANPDANNDRVQFGAGITLADVEVSPQFGDLRLTLAGSNGADALQLGGYFSGAQYQMGAIVFAGGGSWDAATISRKLFWSDDFLQGTVDAETLDGGLGNDVLYSGGGDDVLYGDAGDDWLWGGAGMDTYVFGRGDGSDVIQNHFPWSEPLSEDTLQLGGGIGLSDVAVTQEASNLVLSLAGSADRIVVWDYFSGPESQVQIRFADGASWDAAAIARKLVATDEVLVGTDQVDTLDGGLGNDYISGHEGDDFLYGDAGDDQLIGGEGQDTYFFGRGDGRDVIYAAGMANEDRVQLGFGIGLADVQVSQDAGAHLALTLAGSSERISVWGYFFDPANRIGEVRFNGGASWDAAAIERKLFATHDFLMGTDGADTLDGGLGHDNLIGGYGNDILYGDAGFDTLDGSYGADTYVFGRGDEQDYVLGNPDASNDRVQLGSGITLADVEVSAQFGDLRLTLAGSNGADVLTLGQYFNMPQYQMGAIVFADGSSWDAQAITRKFFASDDFLSGSDGADTLDGGLGNDVLSGGAGDDILYGDAGDDFMHGDAGADTYIFGRGDGADVIFGSPSGPLSADTLQFGSGITLADVVVTQDLGNLVLGLAGSGDRVTVGNYFGGPENQLGAIRFAGGASWDAATIGRKLFASDDFLGGGEGANTLDGGLGNDNLFGGGGDDVLYGDAGTDWMDGGTGADTYGFGRGDGSDVIFAGPAMGEDRLEFGSGILMTDVEVTNDGMGSLVLGVAGTSDQVRLSGYFIGPELRIGEVRFNGGASWDAATIERKLFATHDFLMGTEGADTLDGGLGHDNLIGGYGNDILYGDAGFDTLDGSYGADTYVFGRGDEQDYVLGNPDASNDRVQLGSGITLADVEVSAQFGDLRLTLAGSNGADVLTLGQYFNMPQYQMGAIVFADGSSWDAQAITRKFFASDDFLSGSDGADTLDGGLGNDVLSGGAGDDILYGDAGDDFMHGDAGADTYIFGRGDGADVIFGSPSGPLSADTLQFGSGITLADVVVTQDLGNLVLGLAGSGDRVTVGNYFGGPENQLGAIRFAGGASWDAATIGRKLFASDDFLGGGEGANTLDGGLGNDNLFGGGGDDVLYGDAGTDWMDGGTGADTYGFGRGDGSDVIFAGPAMGEDRLEFGSGILMTDVEVTNDGMGSLVLGVAGTSDQVRLSGYFMGPELRIGEVRFNGGASWDAATIERKLFATHDVLMGTEGADTLDGGLGHDNLIGGYGNDILYGDAGFDTLDGSYGADTYVFGRGDEQDYVLGNPDASNDRVQLGSGITLADVEVSAQFGDLRLTLAGSNGADVLTLGQYFNMPQYQMGAIVFADGSSWDAQAITRKFFASDDFLSGSDGADTLDGGLGNDVLSGGAGDDILYGDAGDDFMHGDAGADTYIFGRGDGADVIFGSPSGPLSADTLQFGSGITLADVVVTQDLGNLVLGLAGSGDRVTVGNYFGGPENQLGAIRFAGGASWDAATIGRKLFASDDFLGGGEGANTLDGGLGNDNLFGGGGDDVLYGDAGTDWMDGGTGADTYGFGRGDGSDVIFAGPAMGEDRLEFGSGILMTDVEVTNDGMGSLVLGVAGTSDQVRLSGYFMGPELRIGEVRFNGGASWDAATIERKLFATHDVLMGTEGADTLDGGLGHDNLIGGYGNDILYGDAGFDTLDGSYGADTYVFGRGDEQDYVLGNPDASNDRVQLGSGITLADVEVSAQFGDLRLTLAGSNGADVLTLGQYFNMPQYQMGAIVFADGSSWDAQAITRKFFASDDFLSGSDGADTLDGGLGNDVLSGGAGDDILYGDAGDDFMHGDAGADTYIFGRGDGADVIFGSPSGPLSADTLQFGSGITLADVVVTQDLGNLVLGLAGSGDRVTVGNYFGGPENQLGAIRFADGTVLTAADIPGLLNDAPSVANPITDQVTDEDAAFSFTVPADAFFDPDQYDSLTYSVSLESGDPLPAWLSFDAQTRTFTGTPANGEVGSISVRVTATDRAGTSASDVFSLAVANTNDAPTVATPLADQNATEDGAFSFTVPADAFAEVDAGDTLTYSATLANGDPLPSWLSFDAGTRTFSGTPVNGDVGTISVRVTASDGASASAFDVFDIAVTNTNDAPEVIAPIDIQSAQDTIAFNFTVPAGTFADVDAGDVLTYSTGALPAWLSFDPLTRKFSGTPGAANLGVTSVEVRATDSAGALVSNMFDITVAPAPDQTITGTPGNNTLVGGSGNDTINGLGGADSMTGNLGNDTYFVDNSGDQVIEAAGGGIDTVNSSISYTLGQNVENLTLTGTANRSGTGNALDNIITGNSGSNSLTGGAGHDTYYTGSGDSVTEIAGGGDDTAYSSVSRTLWANVEALVLTGTSNLTGTGNSAANLIRGNTGGNTLQGQGGIDILEGGGGNDTLSDSSSNSLFNGGAGTDSLTGGSARQLYIGGAGNDTITTGSGADIIAFNVGDGQDDVNASTVADNTLSLGGVIEDIDYDLLAFSKAGNDLVLNVNEVDRVAFKNWYLSSSNRSVANLQVVSNDPLFDEEVQRFNFLELANEFDAARAADPGITSWALMNALLEWHLVGSDDAALGGDLAYRYARDGSLAGIGFTPAQQILGSAQFGTQAQALQDDAALQVGAIRLG